MEHINWGRRKTALAVSFLAAAFVVTGGLAVTGHSRAAAYQHLLENSYQHAFAELTTAVCELDSALQKGIYATSPTLITTLCADAYGKTVAAQMALGELPYADVELEQTAAFIAKAGDYALALSRGALENGGYSDEERENLRALSTATTTLAEQLRTLQADLNAGTLSLEDLEAVQDRLAQGAEDGGDILAGSAFQTVESDFPEVPSLIYDGPFSQHITTRSPSMLEGRAQVSQDEARIAAARFLDLKPEIFNFTAESGGRLPTWDFSALVDGGEVFIRVSKAGGMVTELLNSRMVSERALSHPQAEERATAFLEERGYTDLAESYYIDQGNILTINYAAKQGEVVCYPDLVKVSIALDTGRVMGFENEGYLMNHTTRALEAPTVSGEVAEEAVSPELAVLARQLTLIPTSGEYEVLCHEFKCRDRQGRHYIVYVNAQTGQEEKILILLEDESGTLAM